MCFFWIFIHGWLNFASKTEKNKGDRDFNDKQTYEPLKDDPTPALQRRLNGKLLDLKKTETIDIQLYYRLRCRIPQSAKLYWLPKLHKPNIPMRPIVSFFGSPTYQLSKHLINILKPLTDKSLHKLQSTDNFIDAKQYKNQTTTSLYPSTSNHFLPAYYVNLPLTVLRPPSTNHTTNHHYPQTTFWTYSTFVWSQPTFSKTVNTTSNYTEQLWAHLFPLLWLK